MRLLAEPHEELLETQRKMRTACDLWNNYRFTETPVFFGRKKWEEAKRTVKANYEALETEYTNTFNKILRDNHGIDPADLVKKGHGLMGDHEFTVLLDRKIRAMKAVAVGNRIVFFLDDTALGENEKASYMPK
jgi:hypothetical protein